MVLSSKERYFFLKCSKTLVLKNDFFIYVFSMVLFVIKFSHLRYPISSSIDVEKCPTSVHQRRFSIANEMFTVR